jgi:hypothetical protein
MRRLFKGKGKRGKIETVWVKELDGDYWNDIDCEWVISKKWNARREYAQTTSRQLRDEVHDEKAVYISTWMSCTINCNTT